MRRIFFLLSFSAVLCARAAEVTGPDGRLKVNVDVADGVPCYSVTYDGKTFIGNSPLGFT